MSTLEKEVRAAVADSRSGNEFTRRDAMQRVAALFAGTAVAGQSAWLSGCATARPGAQTLDELFIDTDITLLDDIAETILPETSTPGAKAAGVGPFMALMVADTYTAEEQATFTRGLATIQALSQSRFGSGFSVLNDAQQLQLLEELDREQHAAQGGSQTHYFSMIKQLTLLGYFTSEIGCTQAQRYRETPGRFDPCVPYSPGDRAWAAHA